MASTHAMRRNNLLFRLAKSTIENVEQTSEYTRNRMRNAHWSWASRGGFVVIWLGDDYD